MFFQEAIRSERTRAGIFAGIVFLGVNLLLRVPDLVVARFPLELSFYLSDPSRLYYFFSLDLFCLLSLLVLIPPDRVGSWMYSLLTGAILFLLLYRTYDATVLELMNRSPIVYADHSHVLGALYLLLNASIPWSFLLGGVGVGTGVALLLWWLPSLLETTHRHLRRLEIRRGLLATHLLIWPLVGYAAATDRGIERQTYQEVCLSTVQCMAYNVRASVMLNRNIAHSSQQNTDSTYVGYRALDWSDSPSLYVMMIESYGSVLGEMSALRAPYAQLMARAADTLGAAGWHTATAQSTAPVYGGRSWLSLATVLSGTPVTYQPAYELLRTDLPRYPHLVWLLQRMGYQTGLVQPPVRARPGLTPGNPYGFDQTLYFKDLDYRGPSYGWGIVPDQYSLSLAHERFVEPAERPFFLFFETVTPHAQWDRDPPPVVETPRVLNQPRSQIRPEVVPPGALGRVSATTHPDTLTQPERFFRHVRYDWRVLAKYLRTQAPPNSLVVVLGDHQPFFGDGHSYATPLHVLSRDRALVERFHSYGLTPGLQPTPAADTLHHAGLYSLLVRVLTAHNRTAPDSVDTPLPPYRPQGVHQSALFRSPS